MVRVAKLFQTFTHKLEIFIVLYQFLIRFYQRIKSSNNISEICITILYTFLIHYENHYQIIYLNTYQKLKEN